MIIKLKELLDINYDSVSLFSESPIKISQWNTDLLDPLGKNYLFTIAVKEKGKYIEKFDSLDLYRYISGDYIIDCFISGDYTVSFFQYKIDGKTCFLHRVWQDSTHFGLSRKIIFDYYLKEYDSILTDDAHTEFGEKSIKKLLNHALSLNFKVYVLKDDRDKIYLTDLSNIDNYYSYGVEGLRYMFGIEK
jgi:hypothetical protein